MLLGDDSEDYPVVVQPAHDLQSKERLFTVDGGRENEQASVIGSLGDVVALNSVVMVGPIDPEIDPL